MASKPDDLAKLIQTEIQAEFGAELNETLIKYSNAIARAIHTHLVTNVETVAGQQVVGFDSVNGPVKGQTATNGKVI